MDELVLRGPAEYSRMKFNQTQYPTNRTRNNYSENKKESTIETPKFVAEKIHSIVKDSFSDLNVARIYDIGCFKGNLSQPFTSDGYVCVGIDKQHADYAFGDFKIFDFLSSDFIPEQYPRVSNEKNAVVCNPPFNDKFGEYGRKLLPELFLRKIFSVFGISTPLVFFSPMGILKNQKLSSPRWKWIRDCGAEISSELELPIDAYGQNVLVHSSVLFFNIPGLKPRYFLDG